MPTNAYTRHRYKLAVLSSVPLGGEDAGAAEEGVTAAAQNEDGSTGGAGAGSAPAAPTVAFGAFALAAVSAGAVGLGCSGGADIPFGTPAGGAGAVNPEVLAFLADIGADFEHLAPAFASQGICSMEDLEARFRGLEKVRLSLPTPAATVCRLIPYTYCQAAVLTHSSIVPLPPTSCLLCPLDPAPCSRVFAAYWHTAQSAIDAALTQEIQVTEPGTRITLRNRLLKL